MCQARASVWNISGIFLLALAGCQTPPPRVVTVREPIEVPVVVAAPCKAALPPRPALLTDEEILALPDGDALRALRRRDLQLQAYAAELAAELRACGAMPQAP